MKRAATTSSKGLGWVGLLGAGGLMACGTGGLADEQRAEDTPVRSLAQGVSEIPAYDATFKTVRCTTLTEECNARSLLDGRGQAAFERYAPSTLGGSCPDGDGGDSSQGEWVRGVRVYTQDQKPLTEDREATLEVRVQLPWSLQTNYVDLYATVTPANPTWTWIATRELTTGGGAQTVSVNYTVPRGSGTQAIRAAMRRGGTASPCTSGPYDDRDDLVFRVAPPYVSGARATRVSSGLHHALALREDGTVWGWGLNPDYQLGDISQFGSPSPLQAAVLPGVKSVHALTAASLALRADGTVWAWGGNSRGELGNGSTTPSKTPVQVSQLTNVIALASSGKGQHVIALKADGTVWGWGNNARGQLGDGTTVDRLIPVQVRGLTQVIAISTSARHALALKSDGTVWAWGDNSTGALGDGSLDPSLAPKRVQGLTNVKSIAAGGDHSLAIRGARQLWGWGMGPLGDATHNSLTPRLTHEWSTGTFSVFADDDWTASISMALNTTQKALWSWGSGSDARCQTPAIQTSQTPTPLQGLTGVVDVDPEGGTKQFLLTDGSVRTWSTGSCTLGQLELP